MTLRQLYEEGRDILSESGVPDAKLDARLLLCEAFGMTAAEYLMEGERELAELYENTALSAMTEDYANYIALRRRRMPLQHILGETQFMGLPFAVNANVLIPRQDTETLVEQVLSDFPQPDVSILDMCTGSGCIAASLAVLGGYREVVGADISMDALYVARENAMRLLHDAGGRGGRQDFSGGSAFSADEEQYRQQVRFVQTDLFSGLYDIMGELGMEQFDVIVSNPPYIRSEEIGTLLPEVRDFEPRIALDGSEDGLHFYRRIAKEAGPYLREGGSLYLEIGADEAVAVCELLKDAGFQDINVIRDLAGKDRVVTAKK
ncbi:MAG: HemK/PrmC family methyltransferase [Eubacteriales bacterium]|nr:HemK/PrmC family methyltransferase [Eubacteriales bacterium]